MLANNSPPPLQAAPRPRITPSRDAHRHVANPYLAEVEGARLIWELEHSPGQTATPLFTRIASETQMHHLMPTAQTMTSSRRLVRLASVLT
jgi:hypothetical protein